jgi:hypothetical protein
MRVGAEKSDSLAGGTDSLLVAVAMSAMTLFGQLR